MGTQSAGNSPGTRYNLEQSETLMKTWHTGLWGFICAGSVLLSGCSHTTHKARRDQPALLPASIAAEYAYTRSDSATKVTVVEEGPDSTLKRVLLAAPESTRKPTAGLNWIIMM